MAIIDVTTFNGEYEIFDLRYNILKDYVDEFIVVEFDKTFSGKPKRPYWLDSRPEYLKVTYHYIKESQYIKYKDLADSSPNTIGAEHWKWEFMQKESIKDCLTHLQDDDIVFIGDCDEIWNPEVLQWGLEGAKKLRLGVYTYWLNNYSSEVFNGTLMCLYKDINNHCLNHLRSDSYKTLSSQGWHFTSMAKSLKQKLKDSYTDEDYATDEILESVDDNIKNDRDFLGRPFTYKVEEENWPEYLKKNRQKYKKMLK